MNELINIFIEICKTIIQLLILLFKGIFWLVSYPFKHIKIVDNKNDDTEIDYNKWETPETNLISDDMVEYGVYTQEQQEVERKYNDIVSKHYTLLEKIEEQYSIAINQPTIYTEETTKCINLCLQDMEIAPQFMEYLKEDARVNQKKLEIPVYSSFQRLSLLYEKQGNYDEAIVPCQRAIEIGFFKDGTKSGYKGRIARLNKLKEKGN